MDAGRNAGVSGGIDFPGFSAAIEFTVSGWSLNEAVKAMEDAGRGDGQFTPSIPLNTTGGVTYSGKVRKDAWPSQANFNGITTTTVMTLDQTTDATTGAITASTKATCTLLILSLTLKTNEKDKTLWDITVSGSLQGDIVYSGFGTDANGVTHDQPITTQQTYTDKVRYAELRKTFDKWQLVTDSSFDIRCWGVADNDVAEWNKIGQVALNQASPLPNLKLRTASLVERVSAKVIILRLAYALRDTKDDELFPFEVDQNKVDGLGNISTRAGLNASPISPNTSLFFSGTETRRLTDGTVKIISTFDRWGGEKNQREKTGTFVDRDPDGLTDRGEIDIVVLTTNGLPADPTAPTGLQVVNRTLRDFDNTHADAKFSFAIDTPKQTMQQDASSQNDDPNIIDSSRATALIDATAARATGYRTTGIETKSVRHNRLMTIHRMGKLDSLDRELLPRYKNQVDRDGASTTSIGDIAIRTKEWLTNVSAPTAPDDVPTNNVKLLGIDIVKVYPAIDSEPGLNISVFAYGPKSSRDGLVLPSYSTTTDQSSVPISGSGIRAYLDGESAPSAPSGLIKARTIDRPLSFGLGTNRTLYVDIYAVRTPQQDIEFLQSRAVTDTTNLRKNPIVVKVTASSSHDFSADNPDATNLELIWGISHQETSSGQWVHTGEFGPLAPDTALKAEFEVDNVDPATLDDNSTAAALEDDNTRVIIDTNATAPAAPASTGILTNKVCWKHFTKKRGKVTHLHVYLYRYRDSVRALEAEKFRVSTDVSGLDSHAITAKVFAVASPPTTPVAADYGLAVTLVPTDYEDINTLNPAFRVRIYSWALVTNQQHLEYAQSIATNDPTDVYKRRAASLVPFVTSINSMADALALANPDAAITVVQKTPDLALQIIEKSGEDKKIIAGGSAVRRVPMRGVPVGTIVGGNFTGKIPASSFNNTAAYVKVQVYGRSAGGLGGRIFVPTELDRALGSFIWRRTINTTTPWTYFHSDLIGMVNNAPFLGYPAYNVRYVGAKLLFTTAISYAHLAVIDFLYETDSGMFVNDSAIVIGEGGTNSSPTLASTGFFSATLFDATSLLAWPASADFSPFLSATLL